MSNLTVFDFVDYKTYLGKALEMRSQTQKGQKTKLAEALGCRAAYLSQVLRGSNDLSAEQAQAANRFLAHTPTEARFFLNMVLWARAGTHDLKEFYLAELKKQKDERVNLKNRVKSSRTLSEADQARYYSSWYYAAVHVIVSLNHIHRKAEIAKALGLPQKTISEVLEFLVEIGLLKNHGAEFLQGETSLYLDAGSPFITKHHTNWRMKAVQSLDQKNDKDLHYSGVITCSIKDAEKIQEILIQTVQKIRELVKASNDETLMAYTLDLFSLLDTKE